MDDLLQEFLTESYEHLETVDRQVVEFESDPSNSDILRNIFRLVHTIKGTCGFLGLPRLEAVAHSAESLLGKLRDGAQVTPVAVTLTLESIDRIKFILRALERTGAEPEGDDQDLILRLDALSAGLVCPPEATFEASEPMRWDRHAPSTPEQDAVEHFFNGADGLEDGLSEPHDEPASAPSNAERFSEDGSGSRLAAQTIRVQVSAIERLMAMVSELVLTRNQLLEIARREGDLSFKLPLQRLSTITAELQDGVMKTRMQPIGHAWNKLPRLIREISAELGKKIDLVLEGADTELDRQVLERIKDPLTHMLRNSADHGVEPPHERIAAGKPETGRIKLVASHEGDSIVIRISDDGRGLDIPRIRRKALEAGIAGAAELDRMSDAQVARFIFHAGLSTASAVTNVSGRGVGMDVVKANVDAIGGAIDLAWEPGRGCSFTVKIPLTLAIVPALIVAVGEQRYAIPQGVVRELVRARPGGATSIEQVNGASLLRLRERLLPVVSLACLLGVGAGSIDDGFVVVTQIGRRHFGVMVDSVLQTEEIVVKPMASMLRSIPLFAGNTVLGDGAVVLILDPNGLSRAIGASEHDDGAEASGPDERASREKTQTVLVFKAGGGVLKAVPLTLVTRLEEVDAGLIEHASGRPLLQYRGRLMPIVAAHEALEIRREGVQPLVIVSDGSRAMGLAVESIVDIIKGEIDIELSSREPGVLGSAVLGGRATDMIDLAHYLPQAFPDWLTGQRGPSRVGRDVLLVEQSEFLREMLAPVIQAAGFRPVICADAAEALAALRTARDLGAVVVDVENAASGGLDLIRHLCSHGERSGLLLVGLASVAHADIVGRSHEAGLRQLIAKFDRHALIAALSALHDDLREAA